MTISTITSGGPAVLRGEIPKPFPVDLASVRSLQEAVPSAAIRKLPAGFAPPQPPDPAAMMAAMNEAGVTHDGDPSRLFAEVYKNGEVVARLYNGGSSTTYGQADGIISGVDEPYDGGPQLAQWRADKIAKELGGTVKMASTAQTPSQWALTHAADQAKMDKVMAPYRAAMDAFRAAMSEYGRPEASAPVSVTA
ncbi:hypothetical protein PMI01_01294 [Caulobacter sp. AP07]|uniref:hypothetical protein n=1 Tax=Caulobacter sp. AP07 TaxID=1144304 RepID=UPI000271FC2B|nr:hypothetical protein [Caulobacter sp. AP07]EJL35541.1 hypothetical protein PMI01_01294 [Caulobacter sp. AP07]